MDFKGLANISSYFELLSQDRHPNRAKAALGLKVFLKSQKYNRNRHTIKAHKTGTQQHFRFLLDFGWGGKIIAVMVGTLAVARYVKPVGSLEFVSPGDGSPRTPDHPA